MRTGPQGCGSDRGRRAHRPGSRRVLNALFGPDVAIPAGLAVGVLVGLGAGPAYASALGLAVGFVVGSSLRAEYGTSAATMATLAIQVTERRPCDHPFDVDSRSHNDRFIPPPSSGRASTMRATRIVFSATIAAVLLTGLSACGGSQADELAEQLRKAGYTDVAAEADYDKTGKKKKLDDYEATAKAGSCTVEIEQDTDRTDYVIEMAAGEDVNFRNLTAAALIVELNKQGVKC